MQDVLPIPIASTGLPADNRPAILRGAARNWPAFEHWSFDYLVEKFHDRQYECQVNLPTGVPTLHRSRDFSRMVTMREFSAIMAEARYESPCYLHQRPITQFPGLDADVRFSELGVGDNASLNMWIGSAGTKSSLHFDFQHGLLAQIRGSKRFWLVGPDDTRWLAQIPGVIQKSQVDPENPADAPQLRKATVYCSEVDEGDAIFIPAGWWHAVRGLTPSISVNCFFGPHLGVRERVRYVNGIRSWAAIVRDLFVHGVCGVALPGRLYSAEPFGLWFYQQTVDYFARRLPLRAHGAAPQER